MRIDSRTDKADYFAMLENRLILLKSLADDPDRPSTYLVSYLQILQYMSPIVCKIIHMPNADCVTPDQPTKHPV